MFRKLWEWIKRPHGIALVLFYVFAAICIAGSVFFGIAGQGTRFYFVAYIFYGLGAATLAYTVYTVVIFAPTVKTSVAERLKTNRFAANMLEDYDYKTTVFALLSFAVTVAFAAMNLASAVRYRLVWYGAIAAYYFVLTMFRGGLLLAYKKCAKKYADDAYGYEKSKWKIHLACGAFLIVLELAMIGAVAQMMLSDRPTRSGMIMAITSAAYTFYKIIMAVYNLNKSRKQNNPVTRSFRDLNFADACMSVVSLTVLMIATFDDGPTESMQYMKYAVGFAACAVIIALAVLTVIRADKKIKALKAAKEATDERQS